MVTTLEEKGIYGLVGSPERLRILEELETGPKDRGYFIELLNLWPQAVKYHIDILVNGGLVAERWSKKGRRKKIYTLTERGEDSITNIGPAKNFPSDDWVEVFIGQEGKRTLSYIASISDGKWHDLEEAAQVIGERKIRILRKNGMLEVDGNERRIRTGDFSLTMNSDWVRGLTESENGDYPWST